MLSLPAYSSHFVLCRFFDRFSQLIAIELAFLSAFDLFLV